MSIELPPLPPLGRFSQDFHRMRVMQDGAWCPYDDVKAIDDAREARERDVMFVNRAIEQCDLRSDEAWHYARVGWRRLLRNLTDAEARVSELEAEIATKEPKS